MTKEPVPKWGRHFQKIRNAMTQRRKLQILGFVIIPKEFKRRGIFGSKTERDASLQNFKNDN